MNGPEEDASLYPCAVKNGEISSMRYPTSSLRSGSRSATSHARSDRYIAAELEVRMSVERICTLRGDGYVSPRSRQRFPERAKSMYLFTSRV